MSGERKNTLYRMRTCTCMVHAWYEAAAGRGADVDVRRVHGIWPGPGIILITRSRTRSHLVSWSGTTRESYYCRSRLFLLSIHVQKFWTVPPDLRKDNKNSVEKSEAQTSHSVAIPWWISWIRGKSAVLHVTDQKLLHCSSAISGAKFTSKRSACGARGAVKYRH